MFESGKSAFGKDFELFLKLNDLGYSCSQNSARFL
jgi:hypothetical protein